MPERLLKTDHRFWVLSEALASYVSDADDPPVRDSDVIQAAVALVLRGKGALEMLLIKRARSERDPWSGHMALPGGRRDGSDASLQDTAMRETLEETGLDLRTKGVRLGSLDAVTPGSVRLPSLSISPYVFGATPDAGAHVASPEVAAVHWVRVDELRDPRMHSEVEIDLPGGVRAFPCFRVAGEVVWGLTYRIVTQFLERYPDDHLQDTAPPA